MTVIAPATMSGVTSSPAARAARDGDGAGAFVVRHHLGREGRTEGEQGPRPDPTDDQGGRCRPHGRGRRGDERKAASVGDGACDEVGARPAGRDGPHRGAADDVRSVRDGHEHTHHHGRLLARQDDGDIGHDECAPRAATPARHAAADDRRAAEQVHGTRFRNRRLEDWKAVHEQGYAAPESRQARGHHQSRGSRASRESARGDRSGKETRTGEQVHPGDALEWRPAGAHGVELAPTPEIAAGRSLEELRGDERDDGRGHGDDGATGGDQGGRPADERAVRVPAADRGDGCSDQELGDRRDGGEHAHLRCAVPIGQGGEWQGEVRGAEREPEQDDGAPAGEAVPAVASCRGTPPY
jgi:hypothetical protein